MSVTITRRAISDETSSHSLAGNLPSLLKRIYLSRGVSDDKELQRSLKNLESWQSLKGISEAAALMADAVISGQRILIVGDFDADGATSSALGTLALRAMGAAWVDFLVPNRFEYGYGLSPDIVEVAKNSRPDLLVTVDNGISSIEGVKAAKEAGIKVLITDHHLAGEVLPEADAIVNPNQPGCEFPCKSTAGVGVIFYVLCALRTELDRRGWFVPPREKPNMASFLDLVALGTVADVVGLDSNNRIFVHQGIGRIRAGKARPGILALAEVSRRDPARLAAPDLGFALAPRLNAAGRLDDMSLGIELLITEDPNHARHLASQLDGLNQERRDIEDSMKEEALRDLARLKLDNTVDGNTNALPWGVCLFQDDWHQGVIGILASRVKEKMHRPVIAFAPGNESEIKGSARSIPGFHIRDALEAISTKFPGLILKFGGHAMAAGLSLKEKDYQTFSDAFDQEARRLLVKAQLEASLMTDGELSLTDLNLDTAEMLREAGPWGQNFPEPVFDGVFDLQEQRLLGGKHLKMMVVPEQGSDWIDGICFNVDSRRWPDTSVRKVRLVYRLDVNEFRGRRSVQLMIEHLEPLS
ncbi:single-stranded-DNA-specific exonuclease RecJ [Sansalvadorimonas sp. 2012CJ34-2]|uniref:Single-stranded-DNA-specific exonuclease RecJ n=1 Tax=Parendozoicomonas callyspongiae TaxID=2942213 RepID=A0ABT0PFY5_9GAMM|nr:single-stranded-DNA-specific exonuclease RecJ [Sansalvadorimonas sp. 2012CJ34-2]MCL6270171.1 single-stranded-DNA-specific exonuclease RecJ [Sansalvadorimonas sp. 2012CJ34-2]